MNLNHPIVWAAGLAIIVFLILWFTCPDPE